MFDSSYVELQKTAQSQFEAIQKAFNVKRPAALSVTTSGKQTQANPASKPSRGKLAKSWTNRKRPYQPQSQPFQRGAFQPRGSWRGAPGNQGKNCILPFLPSPRDTDGGVGKYFCGSKPSEKSTLGRKIGTILASLGKNHGRPRGTVSRSRFSNPSHTYPPTGKRTKSDFCFKARNSGSASRNLRYVKTKSYQGGSGRTGPVGKLHICKTQELGETPN